MHDDNEHRFLGGFVVMTKHVACHTTGMVKKMITRTHLMDKCKSYSHQDTLDEWRNKEHVGKLPAHIAYHFKDACANRVSQDGWRSIGNPCPGRENMRSCLTWWMHEKNTKITPPLVDVQKNQVALCASESRMNTSLTEKHAQRCA